jgi:coenzyme F420 hydrogenase subunit beta
MKFKRVDEVSRQRLCMGCGTCVAVCRRQAISLSDISDIGLRPVINTVLCNSCGLCVKVCPGISLTAPNVICESPVQFNKEWGRVFDVWEGYAADEEIRFKGASGGAVTALAAYMIESHSADSVLHIDCEKGHPLTNIPVLSRSRAELVGRTGSRYSPAAPCSRIREVADGTERIVFVGKPCDIAGLSKLAALESNIAKKVLLKISIFCAGTPTTEGTEALLKQLKLLPQDVEQIRYRGYGWPGNVLAKMHDGQTREMTYENAWGGILSNYDQFRCSLCPDTSGEFSDIACADAWHRPRTDFQTGWSIIVAKTETGKMAIRNAIDAGYITANRLEPSVLDIAQRNLLSRRRDVWGRLQVMRFLGLARPSFEGFYLLESWRLLNIRRKLKCWYVTVKHIIKFYFRPLVRS